MLCLSPLLLTVGLASALHAAPAEPVRYENPDLHYSFNVPAGWVGMPREVLSSRGGAPGSTPESVPVPAAGFQAPASTWFHVPALVVTNFPDPGKRPKDVYDELRKDSGPGETVIYDRRYSLVLVLERMPSSDGGEIRRIALFKPGRLGVLHLDFYLPVDESRVEPLADPAIRQVVETLRFDVDFGMKDLGPGEQGSFLEYTRNYYREHPGAVFRMVTGILFFGYFIVWARRRRQGGQP